jgi:flagellar basal-body rod protein FlgF
MNKGIYTALSGAMAQSQRLDTIANNIANVNTPSFKRDQQVFQEYLTAHEKAPTVLETPRIPASIENFYDMNGGDKSYVDAAGTFTDFSQGAVKPTGNKLDVALDGKGFIEVATPSGVRYTRNGSFKMDNQGRIVTKEGYPVLMEGTDPDPKKREIKLENSNVNIMASGEIYQGETRVGRLAIVNVEPADGLTKVGSSMYKLKENFSPTVKPNTDAQIQQGYVENSNVDVVREMTDMIATNRTFEGTQRAIKAFDELQQKLVTTVPKLE